LADRPFLSIGEVLSLLQEEFPNVTISKIRFLESQGLLDPERTPSGYRKFYEPDVERLRWILRQQQENFLPLKVIKGRLSEDPAPAGGSSHPSTTPMAVADLDESAPATRAAAPPPTPAPTLPTSPGPTAVNLTFDELASASRLPGEQLRDLERYGLINGRQLPDAIYYDEEALIVARLAAGFERFGVEARHLRMYKTAAEREAGFFEQIVMPMLKQRNPAARQQALDTLSELSNLGEGLRAAMLRQALKEYGR
jgi:DNA-binding transcriptional MerR regulator